MKYTPGRTAQMKLLVLFALACVVGANRRAPCQLSSSVCKNGVVHFTDIEGDYTYFHALKQGASKAFRKTEEGKPELNDDYCFVNGGDTGDKGKASLRIIKWMVDLKSSNPKRVCLIVGNRDGNKLRFRRELPVFHDNTTLLVPAAHFRPWDGHKLCHDFDDAKKNTTQVCGEGGKDGSTRKDKYDRLKYILGSTMGSGTDERRREHELEEIKPLPAWASYNGALDAACPEMDANETKMCRTYESYRLGAAPGSDKKHEELNLYTQYLESAQVFTYMLNAAGEKKGGIFFVHGTVESNHLWKIPPNTYPTAPGAQLDMKSVAPTSDTPAAHVEALVAWDAAYWTHMHEVMTAYSDPNLAAVECTNKDWETGCQKRQGFMVIEMGMPKHGKNPVRNNETMTYGRSTTDPPAFWKGGSVPQGNLLLDLCEPFKLGAQVVQAVVVGHTPRSVAADVRVSDTKQGCITYNGDTSMQFGPYVTPGFDGSQDGWHHGCVGDPCGGETNVLIKPMPETGGFTFSVAGKIKVADVQARRLGLASSGKIGWSAEGKGLGAQVRKDGNPLFNKDLKHAMTIETEKPLDSWTLKGKNQACQVCAASRLQRFDVEVNKEHGKIEGPEIVMHKRADLLDSKGEVLCASARFFGFDFDTCLPPGGGMKPPTAAAATAPAAAIFENGIRNKASARLGPTNAKTLMMKPLPPQLKGRGGPRVLAENKAMPPSVADEGSAIRLHGGGPRAFDGGAAKGAPRFRGKISKLRFQHEQHEDVWMQMYGHEGAEGFPGDGITS